MYTRNAIHGKRATTQSPLLAKKVHFSRKNETEKKKNGAMKTLLNTIDLGKVRAVARALIRGGGEGGGGCTFIYSCYARRIS